MQEWCLTSLFVNLEEALSCNLFTQKFDQTTAEIQSGVLYAAPTLNTTYAFKLASNPLRLKLKQGVSNCMEQRSGARNSLVPIKWLSGVFARMHEDGKRLEHIVIWFQNKHEKVPQTVMRTSDGHCFFFRLPRARLKHSPTLQTTENTSDIIVAFNGRNSSIPNDVSTNWGLNYACLTSFLTANWMLSVLLLNLLRRLEHILATVE